MKKMKEFLFLVPAALLIAAAVAGFRNNVPIFSQIIFPTEEDMNQQEGITAIRSEEKIKKETDAGTKEEKKEKVAAVKLSVDAWKDGTYTGSGRGYGGLIRVEVQIQNGKIKSIRLVSHDGETPEYFARAKKIIASILREQTPAVDCIAKATLSSNGIRQAVADALNKAGGKKTAVIKLSTKTTTVNRNRSNGSSTRAKEKKKAVKKGTPADGKFTGSAVCENFDYTVTLTATFKGGKAVALSKLKITENDNPENEAFWKKAWKPVVAEILRKQTENGAVSDVDTVSGATYSSNAIVNAYLNARAKAIEKSSGKNDVSQNAQEQSREGEDTSSKADSSPAPTVNLDDSENGESGQTAEEGVPADGTYVVSALCEPDEKKAFGTYTLSAEVTFQGGKMTAMDHFTSTDESNRTYYLRAAEGTKKLTGVVTQLLTNQSVKGLQAVTGATCSSKTIRNLYLMAWSQAAGGTQTAVDSEEEMKPAATTPPSATTSPSLTPAPSSPATPEPTKKTEDEADFTDSSDSGKASPATPYNDSSSENGVKDGTYTVSTMVYPDEWEDFEEYELRADFIFEGGILTDIKNLILSDSSNSMYCSDARNYLLPKITAAKGVSGVDACSGATCSSQAFFELYELAVKKATE